VSGFQGGFTASKRLDPLVVFLGVSYFSSAAREIAGTRVNPSDVVGARTGLSLAVSPATSVTVGFNAAYLANVHASDLIVPNSDRLLSSVDVGFSTLVWNRTLLNITTQFGITGHVPNFRVITSLPVRF
jgi:preprotein translocase subunit SecY